jgi:hypothetical protein
MELHHNLIRLHFLVLVFPILVLRVQRYDLLLHHLNLQVYLLPEDY